VIPVFADAPVLAGALAAALAYAAARCLVGPACRLLAEGGMAAENFRKDVIPVGAGIALPLASLPAIALLGPPDVALVWLLVLFGFGLLGFVDDAAGKGEHGGLAGHARSLLRGRLTTGALKALFGGGLALYAGWSLHGHPVPALLAGAVIALSANAVNLLDVRPGRAIKGALALAACGWAALAVSGPAPARAEAAALLALAPFGAALALLGGDLKARFMIGDAGANALGASAGMVLASLPRPWQAGFLVVLALVHIASERTSLSEVIARNRFLKWLDDLGRRA